MQATTVKGAEKVLRKWFPVKEKQTVDYAFTVKDGNGIGIPAANFFAVTLTFYNPETGAIVNLREDQDVLNANNVTISAAGVVTWSLQLPDVTISNQLATDETHRALFRFFWAAGAKHFPHEVDFVIENLGKLT